MGLAAAAVLVLPVLSTLSAFAAPPTSGAIPEVSLDLERCSALPRPEIVRLLGLELEARVLSPGRAGPHAVRVGVGCAAAGLHLNVADPLTGKTLARTVALRVREDEGALAARMVALSIAELVFTSWMELAQPPGAVPPGEAPAPADLRRAAQDRALRHAAAAPPAERPPPERLTTGLRSQPSLARELPSQVAATPARELPSQVAATPTREPPSQVAAASGGGPGAGDEDRGDGWCVLAVGTAIGPFEGVGLGWGAGGRVGWTAGAPLFTVAMMPARMGAELDLTGAWNEVPSALGNVRVSSFSAAPRLSLKLFPGSGRRAWLELGAGPRLGVARLVGAPVDAGSTRGRSLAGAWAGAAAYAGVGLALGPVVLAVGLEAGQVLRSVSGLVDGDQPISIAGRWLAGSLALGWGR